MYNEFINQTEQNMYQELINALQLIQDFEDKRISWKEYQAKMNKFSDTTLRECHVIVAARRDAHDPLGAL